ncbi:MAG: hypothetical protein R6W06_08745 [Prochlorococcaceae cyanobacterium]
MENKRQLLQPLPSGAELNREELRQTFSEGIGDAINQAAENIQFSRHLFQLADAYDKELAALEEQLRDIAKQIDGVVLSMNQARAVQHLPLARWHQKAA